MQLKLTNRRERLAGRGEGGIVNAGDLGAKGCEHTNVINQ